VREQTTIKASPLLHTWEMRAAPDDMRLVNWCSSGILIYAAGPVWTTEIKRNGIDREPGRTSAAATDPDDALGGALVAAGRYFWPPGHRTHSGGFRMVRVPTAGTRPGSSAGLTTC
jgi:hypothetical protein